MASLGLIVLYAWVQPGASGRTVEASNAFVSGLRRLFSPGVAGIGDHRKNKPEHGSTPSALVTPGPYQQPVYNV